MEASLDIHLEMYRRMERIRQFEETAIALHGKGEIAGSLHTSIGQEAEVVGACMALRKEDYMVGNHRSHGHPIGKGADVRGLMAELLGRKTGVCSGKGGSMHLSDFSVGSLGETSIVGSGLPVATGAALGSKMRGQRSVTLCFFGDGAANEGTFHESLNLASIWALPVIFLCENNMYAVTTAASYAVAVKNIADRAAGYAMPGVVVDGQDVLAMHEATSQAVSRALEGRGPTLIEAKTYRYLDHSVKVGRNMKYRTDDEIATWKSRDPIALFREKLIAAKECSIESLDAVRDEVAVEISGAVEFAHNSPYPDPAEAYLHLYTNPQSVATTAF